jgi:restriction system protein
VSDEKNPEPLPPDWVPQPRQAPPWYLDDGGQDAAATIARNEEHRRRQQAAILVNAANDGWVPRPPAQPIYVDDDGSQHTAAIIAINEHRRRQNMTAIIASMMTNQGGTEEYVPPPDDFPVLVSRVVITVYGKTDEGQLIRAVTLPLQEIIEKLLKDPSRVYEIDDRTWEKIIAAHYEATGLYDEVTLTPPSGDHGRDVIAVKRGFWSVRVIESVKRYKPKHLVKASEVRDLIGALEGDKQATKAVLSTTSDFAPKIKKTPQIMQYVPHRLELMNWTELLKRFAESMNLKSK